MRLHRVPARTGWLWVKLGLSTFFKQPLALAGLFFMFMLLVSVLSMVPLLGQALALALLPAATLGLMAATRIAAAGQFPMPAVLASAFQAGRERARAMLVLGAIYAAGSLLILGLTLLLTGGAPTALVDPAAVPEPGTAPRPEDLMLNPEAPKPLPTRTASAAAWRCFTKNLAKARCWRSRAAATMRALT